MQRYVAEGDSLNDVALYAPSNVLFMQLYRALALASSGRILNSPSLGDREKAFQLALASADAYQKAGQDMAVPIMAAAVLKIHFFYANFLLRDFPGKRNDDIKTLLQPFAQADTNNSALGTLVLLNSVADNNFTKVQALKLAQISPDFKKFLQATGVSVK
jgi:hypothetical protein